jgi:hypothetical protein
MKIRDRIWTRFLQRCVFVSSTNKGLVFEINFHRDEWTTKNSGVAQTIKQLDDRGSILNCDPRNLLSNGFQGLLPPINRLPQGENDHLTPSSNEVHISNAWSLTSVPVVEYALMAQYLCTATTSVTFWSLKCGTCFLRQPALELVFKLLEELIKFVTNESDCQRW